MFARSLAGGNSSTIMPAASWIKVYSGIQNRESVQPQPGQVETECKYLHRYKVATTEKKVKSNNKNEFPPQGLQFRNEGNY